MGRKPERTIRVLSARGMASRPLGRSARTGSVAEREWQADPSPPAKEPHGLQHPAPVPVLAARRFCCVARKGGQASSLFGLRSQSPFSLPAVQ